MKKGAVAIIVIGLIAAAVTLKVLEGYFFAKGAKKVWDVCYEMTNQHIEWTGAGSSGR